MAEQTKIIHPVKYYRDFLSHNLRPDGRELDQFRPVVINMDSIGTADGSAIVKVGNTTAVCGIKAELARPTPNNPEHGIVVPNIELTPACSPKIRPGAPSEEAQVATRMLTELLSNSECLDLAELCVVRERLVWVLYCDIVCLDHDGSLLDVAAIALIAALKGLRLPFVEYDTDTNLYRVDESIKQTINVKTTPVATSFMIFDENIIVTDPNADEETLSSDQVSVVVANGDLCLVHKPGGIALTSKQMHECLSQALDREKKILGLLESALQSNE